MKERRTALYDRSSFNRDIMEIYKVMKYRIYFFLIVFVFMIGGLWASPVKVIVRQPVLPVFPEGRFSFYRGEMFCQYG